MATAAHSETANGAISAEIATALRHSFVYGVGGVLVKGVGFFLLPLYTHYLSPPDYGLLEVLEVSISLLAMFLNMGVTAALLRYYGAAETESQKRKVVGSIFLFSLALSAVVFLGGSLMARPATTLLLGAGVPTIYLFLAFSAFLIAYIANVPYTTLRAKEASVTITALDIGTALGMILLNIYFIAFLKASVMGMLLSRLIINTINIAVLIKWTSRELFGGMDWSLLRRVIGFGAPLVFSNLTMFTLNFSDRFFLQRFQSLEIVGIYSVGYKFGYMLNFLLLQPFNMMWQTRMYIVHRRPDHVKVFSQVFVLYSALLIFAGLGMAVFGPELMARMVDSRYAAGVAVIPVVSLSYVFLGVGYYLQLGMFLASRTGLVGIVSTVAAAINLAANYFLIMHFGMMGAAWATVLGFLAVAAGSYYYSQRVCPLHLPVYRMARALAVAGAVYLISRVLPASSLPIALLLKSALIATFPVLLWLGGCFSSDELDALRSLWTGALRILRPAWLRI